MPWQLSLKGQPNEALELAIVRSDYTLGLESWGWYEPLKKIPIIRPGQGSSTLVVAQATAIAIRMINALNEAEKDGVIPLPPA